eukprot:6448663-Prymnesium_polylepis.2
MRVWLAAWRPTRPSKLGPTVPAQDVDGSGASLARVLPMSVESSVLRLARDIAALGGPAYRAAEAGNDHEGLESTTTTPRPT